MHSQIIIEVFLGHGKIIEALRLANSLSGAETLSARKYLEAAKKTNDPIIFYTVYTWFQQRNIRHRGSPDFLKSNIAIFGIESQPINLNSIFFCCFFCR